MSTQLATTNGRDLPAAWESKLDLIKKTVALNATNEELELFLYQARKTGLDPLARQIYCVKRGGKATIQTGIDGYRLIADRTGLCAGNDDPVFSGEHFVGAEGHEVSAPEAATVTVWKIVHGQRCPFTATARWSEYRAEGPMWVKMPYLMLGKCAEALALRKAFPAELSGLYTDVEMGQAYRETSTVPGAQRVDVDTQTGEVLAPSTLQPAPTPRGLGVADKGRRRIDAELRPAQAPPQTTRLERLEARYMALLKEAKELDIDTIPIPEDADESTLTDLGVSLRDQINDAKKAKETVPNGRRSTRATGGTRRSPRRQRPGPRPIA